MSLASQFVRRGIVYKGVFSPLNTYDKDNVVSHHDVPYICVVSPTSEDPSTSSDWFKFSEFKDVQVSTIGTGTNPENFTLELTETDDTITITLNKG